MKATKEETKDKKEKSILDAFKAACPFFPDGEIRKGYPGSEPDFIVESKSGRIGIELARLSVSFPPRPASFSCSSWLTRSTTLKKRPLLPLLIACRAMAIAKWVLPVPPIRMTLLLVDRKLP